MMQVMNHELLKPLFEIVSFFNRPRQDKVLIKRAGVSLDTALFPLLMRIGLQGPIGIVELSDQVNRDYSTVSRQVDKLIHLGVAEASNEAKDKRVRYTVATAAGKEIINKIVKTRKIMMREALKDWSATELSQLEVVLNKLAETLKNYSAVE
jgi:DNA-binding MarR family transcriptional regulator